MNRSHITQSGSNALASCDIHNVLITNSAGQVKDIKKLVGFIRITESLFDPSLLCELGVIDAVNFFEEFNLTGSEILDITLEQKFFTSLPDKKISNKINLRFFITSYPRYERLKDGHTQAYTITAISDFAYIAPFKKISRPLTKSLEAEIHQILTLDLNIPSSKVSMSGRSIGKISGIIPWSNPLSYALKLTNYMSDEFNSPYLFYQTLINQQININSLASLCDLDKNTVYRTYFDKSFNMNYDAMEHIQEYESLTRITEISSSINMNLVSNAIRGSYASNYSFIDYPTKVIRTRTYDCLRDFDYRLSLSKKPAYDPSFKVDMFGDSATAQSMNKLPNINNNFIFTDRFSGTSMFSGDTFAENTERLNATRNIWIENFATCVHSIKVSGDFNLNAGKIVELKLPKAIDMQHYKKLRPEKSDQNDIDQRLSGNFMIFKTTHMITNGTYMCTLDIRKDSI